MRLSASSVKNWFQYRCERQLRYMGADKVELAAIPVTVPPLESKWAQFGHEFEKRVITELSATESIYRPYGDGKLTEQETKWFLTADHNFKYAYQASLDPSLLDATGGSASSLSLSIGYPDLLRRDATPDGGRKFSLIDIKATRKAAQFHRIQVAFYALILQNLLAQDASATADEFGEIWRLADDGDAKSYSPEPFKL